MCTVWGVGSQVALADTRARMGRGIIMRYNAFVRFASLVLGGILTATLCAATAQTFEPITHTSVPMSRMTFEAQRALDIEEDDERWDGRVNGNMLTNGWAYELNCPSLEREVMCTLEGTRLR